MPVAFRAFHWQPVRRTKKMASIALRSSTRGRWHPNGGTTRWEQRLDPLPQSVRDTPGIASFLMVVRHQGDSYKRTFFSIGYHDTNLLG